MLFFFQMMFVTMIVLQEWRRIVVILAIIVDIVSIDKLFFTIICIHKFLCSSRLYVFKEDIEINRDEIGTTRFLFMTCNKGFSFYP